MIGKRDRFWGGAEKQSALELRWHLAADCSRLLIEYWLHVVSERAQTSAKENPVGIRSPDQDSKSYPTCNEDFLVHAYIFDKNINEDPVSFYKDIPNSGKMSYLAMTKNPLKYPRSVSGCGWFL